MSSNVDGQQSQRIIVNDIDDGTVPVEIDVKEELKNNLLQAFQHDQLFPLVSKEYDIISEDILRLDTGKSFSTKEVAEILSKYSYLYDATKGESYINENRLRWWLNEKEEENFIKYFALEKVGRSWVWKIEAICKAKIVAILRFCKNHPQKVIMVKLTGVMLDTPKITQENIASLIESGNLSQVHSVESLRDILFATVLHMNNNYSELYGQLESLKEENDDLKEQLATLNKTTTTLMETTTSLEETTTSLQEIANEALPKSEFTSRQQDFENKLLLRDQETMLLLREASFKSDLRKKALEEWDKQGFLKRLTSKEADKEKYIEDYIKQHIEPLKAAYKSSLDKPE
ncbi:hypothetical protein ACFPOG_12665 [Paenibacillus aestuarii]|uniref:Uncharacterized protein n=1 Tax=Paenibacillus aestuarii TaxID=516965 RepID=A0ABW0K8U2_9BACL